MNTTEENNKLIAEFMGNIVVEQNQKYYCTLAHYQLRDVPEFHKSWRLIMEVVEKIESLGYWTELVGGWHQEFRIGKTNQTKEFINKDSSSKIEAVYNAVVEFIKFYNSAQKEITNQQIQDSIDLDDWSK